MIITIVHIYIYIYIRPKSAQILVVSLCSWFNFRKKKIRYSTISLNIIRMY